MVIRLATTKDADGLKKLNDMFNGNGCNSSEGIVASLANNHQEDVCVAEYDGELIGFCCGQVINSMCYSKNCGEIKELFVIESFRRQGVGRMLVAFMEYELKKRNLDSLKLFTGDTNRIAQAFYFSMGYEKAGEIMFHKQIDD